MIFRRFRVQVVLRVLVLGGSLFLLGYLFYTTRLYATMVVIGALIGYQVYALVRYVEKTNRELARFFRSVRHADFSQAFTPDRSDPGFQELNAAFSEVMQAFRRTRAEKEEHLRYLQTVVQHIGIGLIAFQRNGDVELLNTAAKRLLRVSTLRNVHALDGFSAPLVETLLRLRSGEKALVQVNDHGEWLQLVMYATAFKLHEQAYTLVSIQNIQSELEEKEMEAWQNLIRVLTHEIMNSITPIASLASTVNELLKDSYLQAASGVDGETIEDMRGALRTIEKRSEGLLHFVQAYRNLTRIPQPTFEIFPVRELFERVQHLMQPHVADRDVQLRPQVHPETLELTADPEMIEQVLINLLLNSIQAVGDRADACIELIACLDERGRVLIQVCDNGPGIQIKEKERIFMPFFTTKQTGSGIGLALSRQMMRLHRGAISVASEPDVKTVFTLRF